MIADESIQDRSTPPNISMSTADAAVQKVTAQVIPLLEERLRVDVNRRKLADVVVRKEVETRILTVRVPVRHERLIVERLEPEYKVLATIDLDNPTDGSNGSPLDPSHFPLGQIEDFSIVYGELASPQTASELLHEIAQLSKNECETIRIEISLKNTDRQDLYQQLIDRYAMRSSTGNSVDRSN